MRTSFRRFVAMLGAGAGLIALLAQAEPATTVRAIDLKQQPAADAATVGSLPAGSPVDLATRQGAWVQLKTEAATGWAKLFDVRLSATGGKRAGGEDAIATTLGLATGTRTATVTTGVRGLDADALEHAVANPQQVQKLDGYASTPQRAQDFARQGNLAPRSVDEPKSGSGFSLRMPAPGGNATTPPENPR